MKLSEIKNLLADNIESYITVIRKTEGDDTFDYQYEINPSTQGPEIAFLNLLLGDGIYKELQDFEVKHLYVGKTGFSIQLYDESDAVLQAFNKLVKQYHMPLVTKKYVVLG